MPIDNRRLLKQVSRRHLLVGASSLGALTLAGCAGSDNGTDESDGSTADGNGNDGDDYDSNDNENQEQQEMSQQFPDWDPNNPEFPQPLRTLLLETAETLDRNWGFEQGSTNDLDSLPERDKPAHGDLPRTVPDDESELIVPDPLVMTVMPDIQGAAFPDTFTALVENIEDETGLDVEYKVLNSTAGMVEAMRSGRVHLGHFNGGAVPYAVNIAGGRPLAMGLFGEGDGVDPWGIRTYTITQMDNDEINTIDDLEGKRVAHTSETSNSGHMAPMIFLKEEGIVPGEDYEIEFSGGHQQSIRSIPLGDYEAAHVASTWTPWMYENDDNFNLDDYKVVFASRLMPNLGSPALTRYNLDPDIVEGIKRAYLDNDYSGTRMEEEMSINTFIEFPDYATVADFILKVHRENGREYELDDLN